MLCLHCLHHEPGQQKQVTSLAGLAAAPNQCLLLFGWVLMLLSPTCLLLQIDPLQTAHLANVLSLQYYSSPVVTLLVSKSAGRYRIQSEHFHAMHLPLQASVWVCTALLSTLDHVSLARDLCSLCLDGTLTVLTVFLSDHSDLAMLQELCQRLQSYFANLSENEPLVITFEVDRHPCCHLPLLCCMIWCAYAKRLCGRKVLPSSCFRAGGTSFE